MFNVAHISDPNLFREKVPESEFEAWLSHVVEILQQVTSDRKWINTGSVLQHDNFLMSSLVGLFQHPPVVVLIFGKINVLETISDMMSTLEKPPTSIEYANNVIGIVEYTFNTCRQEFDPNWKSEKTFKKLESKGIMVHYLYCAAIEGSVVESMMSPTFKELLACTAYIKKGFKEGTPCGDTVRAIVEGTDQHVSSNRILPYMRSLIQLSTAPTGVSEDMFHTNTSCHYCGKRCSEDKLMQCANCEQAVYCSKECQKADWQRHKKICEGPVSCRNQKNSVASQHLVNDFIHNRYVSIMFRIVEECDKAGGFTFNDMVLELAVFPDSTGTIPLMKDPPEFQIVPIARYLDGTRLNEPDSVFVQKSFKDEGQREAHDKKLLTALEYQQSHRKSIELLCLVLQGRTISYETIGRTANGSAQHVFSAEAVEAFRIFKVDGDDSLLWEIFTAEKERAFMRYQLAVHFNERSSNFHVPIDGDTDPQATMAAIQNAIDGGDYA